MCPCGRACITKSSICTLKYITCDNKDRLDVDYLLYLNTEQNYISCGNDNGMDLNRYDTFKIPNIKNTSTQFKLEFWFYTQSYVGNNFLSITVTWDFHLKIKTYYESLDDTFYVTCTAIPDNSNPANDGTYTTATLGVTSDPPIWRYVNCGVDIDNNNYYVSNGYFPGSSTYISSNSPSTNSVDNLFISENSIVSYGITYIREMRLWDCYDCNLGLALAAYDISEEAFALVIHVFQFLDPAGIVVDVINPTLVDSTIVKVTATEKSDYKGSNIVIPTPGISGGGSNEHPTGKPPTCLEDNNLYYNLLEQKGCDSKINLYIKIYFNYFLTYKCFFFTSYV